MAYRTRHGCWEVLPRHIHRRPFAALVLSGRYEEAGDTGRHMVEAGDVVVHQAFESHIDRIEASGAEVLVLDWGDRPIPIVHGRHDDPDAIARLAELDPLAAADCLADSYVARSPIPSDWPDLLAEALRADPALSIRDWAGAADLHLGSVSRGFRHVFGVTPKAYRLVQRTLRAVRDIQSTPRQISMVALDCGFADQAHMARAVRNVTSLTPRSLRASGRPVK